MGVRSKEQGKVTEDLTLGDVLVGSGRSPDKKRCTGQVLNRHVASARNPQMAERVSVTQGECQLSLLVGRFRVRSFLLCSFTSVWSVALCHVVCAWVWCTETVSETKTSRTEQPHKSTTTSMFLL